MIEVDGMATIPSIVDYLVGEFAGGSMHLFTGAGFSSDTRDYQGRAIPTGPELSEEIWPLCFPDEPCDRTSSLQDLFHVALAQNRQTLGALLTERLTVDPQSLAPWYALWFSLPWRRVFTVNVDNLEIAVAHRYQLPRPLRTVSALDATATCSANPEPDMLEVIHLNGLLQGGPEGITFSTTQYGSRLAHLDDCYRLLGEDLERFPFLFVGTKLSEAPLWQHLDGRKVSTRPRSFVVSPQLSRARQRLLEGLRIEWIVDTAAGFSETILVPVARALMAGRS